MNTKERIGLRGKPNCKPILNNRDIDTLSRECFLDTLSGFCHINHVCYLSDCFVSIVIFLAFNYCFRL
jgi:hypothetical protein